MSVRLFISLLLMALATQPAAPQSAPTTSPSAADQAVDDLISRATAPTTDPAQRDALLAQAAQLMRQRRKEALTRTDLQPADALARMNLELKLAETDALLRGGPYASRLLDLQGADDDRRRLAELSADALARLRDLSREIDGKLVVWRGDYKLLVTAVPALENLRSATAYKTAWVALYRALTLPPGDERDALLTEAAALAQPFTQPAPAAPDGGDPRRSAYFLVGVAWREHGQFAQAADALLAAADSADLELRAEARFQAARNLIEHGLHLSRAGDRQAAQQQWAAATQAITAYVAAAIKARGPNDPTADDLKAALLTHALHQAQAAGADTADAQRDHERQAQDALADFATRHPQAASQPEFLAALADKYRSVQDPSTFNTLILLALAVDRVPSDVAHSPRRSAEACELLSVVLARRDAASAAVHPAALWHLATLQAARSEPRQAAQLFAQLAREHPDSPFARPAALNTVVCYNNLLSASPQAAEDPAVQADFLAALEALLTRWGTEPDVAGWHFDLGWRYEKVAESAPPDAAESLRDKALAAYQAVPSTDPRHLQAARQALAIRTNRLLDQLPDDASPVHRRQAEELVAALRTCAREAQAAKGSDARDTGAWAELTTARILTHVLDRRDDALALLHDLPARWAGSPVVADAMAFHAQTLLADGQVDQAVSAVQALGKDRPDQARSLGRRLLDDMARRSAATAPATSPAADPSSPYVQARVRLAEYLLRSAELASSPDALALRQAYAEALLDARRPAEALELLLVCLRYAEAQAAQRREQIGADLAANLAAVDAAHHDIAKLRALAAQLLGDLASAGLDPTDSRGAWAVRGALAALDGAVPPEEHDRLLEQLASALQDGYRQLAQVRTQAIPARGDVLQLLAHAYTDLARFTEAAQTYGKLTEGIDPRQDPAAYWAAELGYCRSILACRADDPRAMRSLIVRIAQLKVQDPALGGLADQFAAIESQAARANP